ncbi:MAG: hypothetical protein PPP58_00690 [Natronomonas sp.]
MYTGRTEKPCCLCGRPETDHRIDIPPRAVQLLKHSGPIAWQDIEGEVSLYFCADDFETVRELVFEAGMSPLSRCNAARASFVLREDFEALLNDTRETPDQTPLEQRMLSEAIETTRRYEEGTHLVDDRDAVEALVVRWALEDLDAATEQMV